MIRWHRATESSRSFPPVAENSSLGPPHPCGAGLRFSGKTRFGGFSFLWKVPPQFALFSGPNPC